MSTPEHIHQQAIRLINQRQFVQAHPYCVQLVKMNPKHADAYFLLGIINAEVGQIRKAFDLMEKALSFGDKAEYGAHAAKMASLLGRTDVVLNMADRYPANDIRDALSLDTLGVALSHLDVHERAVDYFTAAIELQPENAQFHYNYGVSKKFLGEFTESRQALEKAIALQPDHFQAHFTLADLGGISETDNHIDRLNACLSRVSGHTDAMMHIGHSLYKEYESLKDYDKAFDALASAKAKRAKSLQYDVTEEQKVFDYLMSESYSTASGSGCPVSQPIFVLGMPRSGTTLVDRILGGHTQVKSAGELQDFGVAVKEVTGTPSNRVLDLETLTAAESIAASAIGERYMQRVAPLVGGSERFVDKLPFNFFYVHLIRRALPNAKIVCLLRDPMDTCFGNFRQLFTLSNPYYHYSNSLDDLARFYSQFYQLAAKWQVGGDSGIKVLSYEALASEPEKTAKELLRFCELEWQPNCLDIQSNTTAVSTASSVQVREAINTRSIGRWKTYQSQLTPLQEKLQSLGVDC